MTREKIDLQQHVWLNTRQCSSVDFFIFLQNTMFKDYLVIIDQRLIFEQCNEDAFDFTYYESNFRIVRSASGIYWRDVVYNKAVKNSILSYVVDKFPNHFLTIKHLTETLVLDPEIQKSQLRKFDIKYNTVLPPPEPLIMTID